MLGAWVHRVCTVCVWFLVLGLLVVLPSEEAGLKGEKEMDGIAI